LTYPKASFYLRASKDKPRRLAIGLWTRPEAENYKKEISNEGSPAFLMFPVQHTGTFKAGKKKAGFEVLPQWERDG
jgi:hypothetical protein